MLTFSKSALYGGLDMKGNLSKAAEAENRFSKIESELAVLRWMVGFVIALLSAVALKLFLH